MGVSSQKLHVSCVLECQVATLWLDAVPESLKAEKGAEGSLKTGLLQDKAGSISPCEKISLKIDMAGKSLLPLLKNFVAFLDTAEVATPEIFRLFEELAQRGTQTVSLLDKVSIQRLKEWQ